MSADELWKAIPTHKPKPSEFGASTKGTGAGRLLLGASPKDKMRQKPWDKTLVRAGTAKWKPTAPDQCPPTPSGSLTIRERAIRE